MLHLSWLALHQRFKRIEDADALLVFDGAGQNVIVRVAGHDTFEAIEARIEEKIAPIISA